MYAQSQSFQTGNVEMKNLRQSIKGIVISLKRQNHSISVRDRKFHYIVALRDDEVKVMVCLMYVYKVEYQARFTKIFVNNLRCDLIIVLKHNHIKERIFNFGDSMKTNVMFG